MWGGGVINSLLRASLYSAGWTLLSAISASYGDHKSCFNPPCSGSVLVPFLVALRSLGSFEADLVGRRGL